jgi:tetratricopeptide (TPR) repeat protein
MFDFSGRKTLHFLVFIVLSFGAFKITAQTTEHSKNLNNFISAEKKKNIRQAGNHKEREIYLNKIEAYKQAITESPDNALLYNNLGTVYAKIGNDEEAIVALKKSIELKPDFAGPYFNLSVIYDNQERFAEAFEFVQKAVLLDNSNAAFRSEKCQLLVILERYKESVPCYEILFQLKEPDMQERTNYGLTLIYEKQSEKALSVLQKNIQLFPDEALSNNALGMYYFLAKKHKQALPYFKRAVELDSRLFAARYNLALTQLATKDRESAIKNYAFLKNSESKYAAKLYGYLFSGMIIQANK